jgi:uncharacterized protein (DUF1330 family)
VARRADRCFLAGHLIGSPGSRHAGHNMETETIMAKAYWVSCYRSISNPDAVAAYAKLAGPALAAAGGRFLARGIPAQTYEAGVKQRMVVVEFDSVAAAMACHDGAAYQAALKVFNGAAERDFRIIEGLE